jgi:hypothetical protein
MNQALIGATLWFYFQLTLCKNDVPTQMVFTVVLYVYNIQQH